MIIKPVHKDSVRREWPAVHEWISDACGRVGEDPVALFLDCLNRPDFFLVRLEDEGKLCGAAVFSVDLESVHGVAIAGTLPEVWPEVVNAFMERLARSLGVNRLTLEGRRGWVRLIRHLGWENVDGVITREVHNGQKKEE